MQIQLIDDSLNQSLVQPLYFIFIVCIIRSVCMITIILGRRRNSAIIVTVAIRWLTVRAIIAISISVRTISIISGIITLCQRSNSLVYFQLTAVSQILI